MQTKMRPEDIETWEELCEYSKQFKYYKTICGDLRQNTWKFLIFGENGNVTFAKNGYVLSDNLSFKSMAVLMNIIGKQGELLKRKEKK